MMTDDDPMEVDVDGCTTTGLVDEKMEVDESEGEGDADCGLPPPMEEHSWEWFASLAWPVSLLTASPTHIDPPLYGGVIAEEEYESDEEGEESE
jgi:hypothetical protein